MINYYTGVLKNYVGFEGRARRAEFWQFVLVNFVISVALDVVGLVTKLTILAAIYGLAVFLPGLAATVRRLHDTSKSGWWILIAFVPVVGIIALIVLLCLDSTPGPNAHGPNPKGVGNVADQYAGGQFPTGY
jgi:uncharacterized membrane protein YhaH (DUF805 family)